MKSTKNSFLDFRNFERRDLVSLFKSAELLRQKQGQPWSFQGTAALLFFESSTRTRMSFETACWNVGLGPILMDINSGSSLAKGESPIDTVLNVAAMNPRVIIIRCGGGLDLAQLDEEIQPLIVNGGWGSRSHPSQALLDLYTLWRERDLEKTKLLIVGDILHSRVASSHFEIFHKMGVEVAACGPSVFKPEVQIPGLKWFDRLDDGLQWCDSVMALRLQTERHSNSLQIDPVEFHQGFGLTKESLKGLKQDGIILHPGPVNWGVELSNEVFKDSRCRILNQVNNGVFVRTALLRQVLG